LCELIHIGRIDPNLGESKSVELCEASGTPAGCGSCASIYNKPLPLIYMCINTPQHDHGPVRPTREVQAVRCCQHVRRPHSSWWPPMAADQRKGRRISRRRQRTQPDLLKPMEVEASYPSRTTCVSACPSGVNGAAESESSSSTARRPGDLTSGVPTPWVSRRVLRVWERSLATKVETT
jgi:hypothetical protein